jgi:hypothetical protein
MADLHFDVIDDALDGSPRLANPDINPLNLSELPENSLSDF